MAEKEYTPWSRESEDGLITSAVDSHVSVSQNVVPALNVGTIDRITGKWEGVQVSDSLFLVDPVHEAVANGASVLSPQQADHQYIDTTGFQDILIAIKPSNTGNYTIAAVMGPDSYNYANLSPVNPASLLKYIANPMNGDDNLQNVINDETEALTADVWNIFLIQDRASNQKLMQFKLTNNSGGNSNIQFASLRLV